MDDIRLRKHVLDELAFEPSVDAAHIGAAVADGIVTLSGTVRTFAEQRTAEIAAARVAGVKAVVVHVRVVPEGSLCTSDEDIARTVLQTLEWNAHIPAGAVQVRVEDGWVTLSGEVDFYRQRRSAEEAIEHLPGIIGIRNRINMRPNPSAADIENRVAAVLNRHTNLSGQNIHAKVFGGMVTLSGTVSSIHARQLAERGVWGVPGVQWVDDGLTVEPAPAASSAAAS